MKWQEPQTTLKDGVKVIETYDKPKKERDVWGNDEKLQNTPLEEWL